MTTLAEMRQFAAEVAAPDPNSQAGDREIQHWINAALARIWRAHSWRHAIEVARITLDKEESGSFLTMTNDSSGIALAGGETLDPKYVSERWALIVDGEGRMTFELASIDDSPANTLGTLASGHKWTLATAAGLSYVWSRYIYPLPKNAKEIMLVEFMQTRLTVRPLAPHEFDVQRQTTPTQRGQDPIFYTTRQGNIEFWPGPGLDLKAMQITFRRQPPRYAVADPGTTVIDWPTEWQDLLEAGIVLQASITQGRNAPTPYPLAKNEWDDLVRDYKAEDSGLDNLSGPMSLSMRPGIGNRNYERLTDYPANLPEL